MRRLDHNINKRASVEEQKLWTLDTPSDRQIRGHIGHFREARAYTEFLYYLLSYSFTGVGGVFHMDTGELCRQKKVSGYLELEAVIRCLV